MNDNVSIDVQKREVTGKKVKQLRKQGMLPATVYGWGVDTVSVQLDEKTFSTLYHQVGRTTLLTLDIPGESAKQQAFIQDIQRHPVSRNIIHVDFRVVDMKLKMNAEIPVVLVGESLLVSRGDAIYNQIISSVEINALPADIPHYVEVDVSALDSFDKTLYVSDLSHGQKFTFVTPEDTMIISLAHSSAGEAEEETVEEEPAESEPALIRKERDAE